MNMKIIISIVVFLLGIGIHLYGVMLTYDSQEKYEKSYLNKIAMLQNELEKKPNEIIRYLPVECPKDDIKLYSEKIFNLENERAGNIAKLEKCSIITEEMPFMEVAANVAKSHIYDEKLFNCVQFSEDFVDKQVKAGYAAKTIIVKTNCESPIWNNTNCRKFDGRHEIAVMMIPFEPQTGMPILPENYDDYGIYTSNL